MHKWIFTVILFYIINIYIYSEEIIHVVKKGDTLYSISRSYNISLDEILIFNNIPDPSRIVEGYKLKIPFIYIVEKGDTLYSISRTNNIDLNELMKLNDFDNSTILKIGQKIRIPQNSKRTETIAEVEKQKKPHIEAAPAGNENKDFYWPVNGEIEKLSGKLQGSKISAQSGDRVFSVSSGRVVWEGPYRGFGRVIFVESLSGYVYVYGGNDKTNVEVGDLVEPGTSLGEIGINVYDGKPSMFFSVYKDGQPIDVEKAPRL